MITLKVLNPKKDTEQIEIDETVGKLRHLDFHISKLQRENAIQKDLTNKSPVISITP